VQEAAAKSDGPTGAIGCAYRLDVLRRLPGLRKLDGIAIDPDEREAARAGKTGSLGGTGNKTLGATAGAAGSTLGQTAGASLTGRTAAVAAAAAPAAAVA